MTVGETIAVAVAVVDVAYVVWGYRLRTALDRTKRHIPLSTDPALRANWSDAAQDVAREPAADQRRFDGEAGDVAHPTRRLALANGLRHSWPMRPPLTTA